MRPVLLGLGLLAALAAAPQAGEPVARAVPGEGAVLRVWAPSCPALQPGQVVRSARPLKDGGGTDRRRFWRGHWRVTQVLDGGRFLADPLYRKDDATGEIRRGAFGPFPGETARAPPGALMCEAFVTTE
jgi:hypothetical protein